MQKLLRYFFIGILFPLLVQYVCYYMFTTNYTTNAFSKESFSDMYNSSVYKSRIIGKELQLWTYEKLSGFEKIKQLRTAPETDLMFTSKRLEFMDPTADPVFYFTCFILAALFTVLTAVTLLKTFDDKSFFPADRQIKDLTTCFLVALIGLTQFVVTPYDNPGYFFMALAIFLFLRYYRSGNRLIYIAVLLTIAIATFNRETSLLVLSFMAAVYFSNRKSAISWIKKMVLPALFFLLPYLYLKFFHAGGTNITEESKLAVNLDITNSYALRGLAFGAFVLYFLFGILNRAGNRQVIYFLLFSLPYIIIIHLVGVMIEYRLWMPILIGGVVISLMEPSRESIKPQPDFR